ncbi:MAG: hypothetical protein VCC01_02455 [Candidatus Hydrogenedentota bacterium]
MDLNRQNPKEKYPGGVRLLKLVIRAVYRQLSTSFYLALAMIFALVLGVSGFDDLSNPKQIAFTMTLFVVFFGAIVYRAMVEALEIARDFRKEKDVLMQKVFARDDFASDLGKSVAGQNSKSTGPEL